MTKTDIGTPEAAVRSCVALIASVTGQPEELTERYLDLYYQVRRQAERTDCHGQCEHWPRNDAVPEAKADTPSTAETPSAAAAAVPSERAPKAKADGGKGKKVDFEEVLASASAGAKMPPEKKKGFAPYGAIKAEILSRYIDLRAKGMTIAQTVNLSGGKVSEGKILTIMNGGKVGMDAYNAIEDAMNKWEATVKAAGQADSTTE